MDPRRLDGLVHWHRRLETALELPFIAQYSQGDEEYFVIVHHVYDPRELEPGLSDQLMCDARQENRPMFIPLAAVSVDSEDPNAPLLSEYRNWLHSGI